MIQNRVKTPNIPPSQRRIAGQDIKDAPSEPWVDAIVDGANQALLSISRLMTQNGISLKSNTNVEFLSFRVTVPDIWNTAALQNSWTNVGSTHARFSKDAWGNVEIWGTVHPGTPTATILTLPVGFRPSQAVPVAAFDPTSGYQAGVLSIGTDGTVTPQANFGAGQDLWFQSNFHADDATPMPSACWPIHLKTRFQDPPLGVIVISCRSANLLETGAKATMNNSDATVVLPSWRFVKGPSGPEVRILDIPGLTPNKTHKIDVVVFGA